MGFDTGLCWAKPGAGQESITGTGVWVLGPLVGLRLVGKVPRAGPLEFGCRLNPLTKKRCCSIEVEYLPPMHVALSLISSTRRGKSYNKIIPIVLVSSSIRYHPPHSTLPPICLTSSHSSEPSLPPTTTLTFCGSQNA